ncbi:MAG: hypothetical protein HWD61_11815 [Parachlamydiaceae bacterium]|nr:MAG: hypothetical protein HWD61_11815 [Parachlamydiaceae bacterium]
MQNLLKRPVLPFQQINSLIAQRLLNYTVKGIDAVDTVNAFVGNQVLNPIKKVIHIVKSKLLGKELKNSAPTLHLY